MSFVKKILQKISDLYKGSRPVWMALVALSLCLVIGVVSAFYNFVSNKMQMDLGMNEFSVIGDGSSSADSGVKNNTGRNAYVRAYIVPCWQQTNEDGTPKLEYEYLGYSEWDISEKINSGDLVVNDTDWRKEGNYYYYKSVLANQSQTSALVNSFNGKSIYTSQRMSQYNPKILLPNDLSNNTYNKNYIYPHLKYFDYVDRNESEVKIYQEVRPSDLEKTVAETDYAGGTGTEADPFLISTGEQLLKCVTSSGVAENGAKLHFKLVTDIYLNTFNDSTGTSLNYDQWFYSRDKKIRFCGCFDGSGYTVNGLYINYNKGDYSANKRLINGNDNVMNENGQDKTFGGLFPCLGPGAEIRNLGIVEATLWSLPYSGAIAGYVCARSADDEPIIIENCYVQNAGSPGFSTHTENSGDAIGGLVGYAELASTTTSGEPLLQINNFYVATRFDVWGENTTVPAADAYRTATVGHTNTPSQISVSNGYYYCITEDNTASSSDTKYEDDLAAAPAGVNVTNVFTHRQTSDMVKNYSTIKNGLSSVYNNNGTDFAWSFEEIREDALYPADGLLVSTEFYRALTSPYEKQESKYLAKQAYKVVYELIQAEGTADWGTTTPIEDAWYTEGDFIQKSDVDTLKNDYDFMPAINYGFYKYDGTSADYGTGINSTSDDRFQQAGTAQNGVYPNQPTISGTPYIRFQPNSLSSAQTIFELTSSDGYLNKSLTPTMSYIVYAKTAGTYTVAPEFVVGDISNPTDMCFLVSANDEKYYRSYFSNTNGNYSANLLEISLKEGINIVRVICPGDLSAFGGWINHNGLWIEKNDFLEVKTPQLSVVDFAEVVAVDTSVDPDGKTVTPLVAINEYGMLQTNNQNCINTGYALQMNRNLITLENLNATTINYSAYTSFQVDNKGIGGYYDITLGFNTNIKDYFSEGYIVVRVNGVNYQRQYYIKGSGESSTSVREDLPLNISVYLKTGTNNITITAPLETSSPEDSYKSLRYVSWFNQYGVKFYGDGTITHINGTDFTPSVETDPDADYLVPPHISILEAETYALTNRYGQVESSGGATVIGGIEPWYSQLPDWSGIPTDSYVERNETYYLDDNVSAHVDYTVCAPAAGTYKIKPRFYLVFEDNKWFDGCSYFIMVNDKFKKINIAETDLERDDGGRFWYQQVLDVDLVEGVNVIRFISVDANTSYIEQVKNAAGETETTRSRGYGIEWFNHDYLELISDSLIGVKSQAAYRGAIQSHYSFSYNGAKYQTTEPIGYNNGDGDFATESNLFSRYRLKYIQRNGLATTYTPENVTLESVSKARFGSGVNGLPAISYTVSVPTSGYYAITLSCATNENLTKGKLAVFVNDGIDTAANAIGTQKRKYIIDFMAMKVTNESRVDCSVYFEKGINVITITCPIDSGFINNSNRWFDLGAIRITGGMEFTPYHSRVNPIERWSTGYIAGSGETWTDRLGK